MFQVFFLGFTSGCLIGFTIEWFWKVSRSSKYAAKVKDEVVFNTDKDGENIYKLVLVVNAELKMGEGKVVAQCAHAAVGTYEDFYKTHKSNFQIWERQGKHVSVYKISDTSTLKSLYKSVKNIGMVTCLVRDAGRTQIATGSSTVLAIGPEEESILGPITQHLLPYS